MMKVRVAVAVEESDRKWLERHSKRHGRSVGETVRVAIGEFKKKRRQTEYRKTLEDTAGLFVK